MFYKLVIVTMMFMAPAFAPSYAKTDCKDPQTQADMNICSAESYKKADKELNDVYKQAVAKIKKSSPDDLERFKNIQRAWIKFRDLNCQYASSGYGGGTMAPLVHANCMEKLTKERTQQIPDLFAEWE